MVPQPPIKERSRSLEIIRFYDSPRGLKTSARCITGRTSRAPMKAEQLLQGEDRVPVTVVYAEKRKDFERLSNWNKKGIIELLEKLAKVNGIRYAIGGSIDELVPDDTPIRCFSSKDLSATSKEPFPSSAILQVKQLASRTQSFGVGNNVSFSFRGSAKKDITFSRLQSDHEIKRAVGLPTDYNTEYKELFEKNICKAFQMTDFPFDAVVAVWGMRDGEKFRIESYQNLLEYGNYDYLYVFFTSDLKEYDRFLGNVPESDAQSSWSRRDSQSTLLDQRKLEVEILKIKSIERIIIVIVIAILIAYVFRLIYGG